MINVKVYRKFRIIWRRLILLIGGLISGVVILFGAQAFADPAPESAGVKVYIDIQGSFPVGDDVETHAISEDLDFTEDEVQNTDLDTLYGVTVGFIAPLNKLKPHASPNWSKGLIAQFVQGNTKDSGGPGKNIMLPNTPGAQNDGYSIDIEERMTLIDIETRYTVPLDKDCTISNLIFKVGGRIGYYNLINASTNMQPGTVRFSDNTSTYVGVGIHAGTEFTVSLAKGFNIDFGFGVGTLLGRQETFRRTSEVGQGDTFRDEINSNAMVPTLDASIALRKQFTYLDIAIGAKFDALFDVRDESLSNNAMFALPFDFDTTVNQYFVSPFFRISASF